jgi:hypothetical protein
MESSKKEQVGGSHYQMEIQPIDFIMRNNIPFAEGNVIKYVTRHRQKNGIEDLRKAMQYLKFIAMDEYNQNL